MTAQGKTPIHLLSDKRIVIDEYISEFVPLYYIFDCLVPTQGEIYSTSSCAKLEKSDVFSGHRCKFFCLYGGLLEFIHYFLPTLLSCTLSPSGVHGAAFGREKRQTFRSLQLVVHISRVFVHSKWLVTLSQCSGQTVGLGAISLLSRLLFAIAFAVIACR